MKVNRLAIVQLHMLVAGFILPVAILYFVSGLLYTSDIKGSVDKQEITLQLAQPFRPDLDFLQDVVEHALHDHQLPVPDAEPKLKKKKGTYELRWGDLPYYAKLIGKPSELTATLIFKERSVLTQIMRIHRAEAGNVFKVLSVVMVVGLLVIFISGIYMAMTIPRFRKPLLFSISTGLALFIFLLL